MRESVRRPRKQSTTALTSSAAPSPLRKNVATDDVIITMSMLPQLLLCVLLTSTALTTTPPCWTCLVAQAASWLLLAVAECCWLTSCSCGLGLLLAADTQAAGWVAGWLGCLSGGWWLVGRPSEPRPPVCYLLEGLACC